MQSSTGLGVLMSIIVATGVTVIVGSGFSNPGFQIGLIFFGVGSLGWLVIALLGMYRKRGYRKFRETMSRKRK
ncbi:MAG: hypothetical protein D6816_11270 [Bacteroidetes bacterium]|nr:MAG: hypothetical protein D6816_11270 [Bacteroidota bacterium]